jgi:hypothetical protein
VFLGVIRHERECKKFTPWQQGFSPKEHAEMLHEQQMRQWQESREDKDREWQAEQAGLDHEWRVEQAKQRREWEHQQEANRIRREDKQEELRRTWEQGQEAERANFQKQRDKDSQALQLRILIVSSIVLVVATLSAAFISGGLGYWLGKLDLPKQTTPAKTESVSTPPSTKP